MKRQKFTTRWRGQQNGEQSLYCINGFGDRAQNRKDRVSDTIGRDLAHMTAEV